MLYIKINSYLRDLHKIETSEIQQRGTNNNSLRGEVHDKKNDNDTVCQFFL